MGRTKDKNCKQTDPIGGVAIRPVRKAKLQHSAVSYTDPSSPAKNISVQQADCVTPAEKVDCKDRPKSKATKVKLSANSEKKNVSYVEGIKCDAAFCDEAEVVKRWLKKLNPSYSLSPTEVLTDCVTVVRGDVEEELTRCFPDWKTYLEQTSHCSLHSGLLTGTPTQITAARATIYQLLGQMDDNSMTESTPIKGEMYGSGDAFPGCTSPITLAVSALPASGQLGDIKADVLSCAHCRENFSNASDLTCHLDKHSLPMGLSDCHLNREVPEKDQVSTKTRQTKTGMKLNKDSGKKLHNPAKMSTPMKRKNNVSKASDRLTRLKRPVSLSSLRRVCSRWNKHWLKSGCIMQQVLYRCKVCGLKASRQQLAAHIAQSRHYNKATNKRATTSLAVSRASDVGRSLKHSEAVETEISGMMELVTNDTQEVLDQQHVILPESFPGNNIAIDAKYLFCCVDCDYVGTKQSLGGHRRRYHRAKEFKCSQCPRSFSVKWEADRHMKTHENGKRKPRRYSEEKSKNGGEKMLVYRCVVCDFKSRSFVVRAHIRAFHMDSLPKCSVCEKVCANDTALELHLKQGCGKPVSSKQVKTEAHCEICLKKLNSAKSLEKHMLRVHTPEAHSHKCKVCDKTFALQMDLKMHEATHTNTNQVACEVCGVVFNNYRYLEKHIIRLHSTKEQCICPLCHRVFNEKNALNKHLRHHLPPEQRTAGHCKICNRTFLSRRHFRDHMNSHRGVNKYECEHCGDKFNLKVSLDAHVRRAHSGSRPLTCPIDSCGKSFRSDIALARHYMSRHPEVSTYPCELCGRVFGMESVRDRHKCQGARNIAQVEVEQSTMELTQLDAGESVLVMQVGDSEVVGDQVYESGQLLVSEGGEAVLEDDQVYMCGECDVVMSSMQAVCQHMNDAHALNCLPNTSQQSGGYTTDTPFEVTVQNYTVTEGDHNQSVEVGQQEIIASVTE